jgi:hypothetical protein
MKFWNDARLKRRLANATVVSFDARGCMAHDHQFKWIGVVSGFEPTRYAGVAARVRVVKVSVYPGDCRDGDLGTELCPINDTCLQELAPGRFILVR